MAYKIKCDLASNKWMQGPLESEKQYRQSYIIKCFSVLLLWREAMTTAILRKHLIGLAYNFRGLVLFHDWEHGWHTGRHGTGEVVESATSGLPGSRKSEWLWPWHVWASDAQSPSPVTHLKKATPPNPFKYCHSLSNQIREPMRAILISTFSWHVTVKIIFFFIYASISGHALHLENKAEGALPRGTKEQ